MPKTKAGTLKPIIDQLKKTITERGDATPIEQRPLTRRLKRLQRKARRIHTLEQACAAKVKPAQGKSGKEPTTAAPAEETEAST